jgi:hypothetical protein
MEDSIASGSSAGFLAASRSVTLAKLIETYLEDVPVGRTQDASLKSTAKVIGKW